MSTGVNAVVPTAVSTLDTTLRGELIQRWSYECSLVSSDIDLTLRDDLSASVQDYLMRIVDELQQLSKWAATCQNRIVNSVQEQQQQAVKSALLLAQTETQLLRSEMQQHSQEMLQRATTQLAYMQNSFRSEYSDHATEIERRLEDKLYVASNKAAARITDICADATAQVHATNASLRELECRLDEQHTRLSAIERQVTESLAAEAASKMRQQHEHSAYRSRLDHLEGTLALQMNEMNIPTSESVRALRDVQTQLAIKLQVIRKETQEQRDEQHQQMQQVLRCLHRVSTGCRVDVPRSTSPVVMPVGAAALGGPRTTNGSECFLHAEAALPSPRAEGDGGADKRQQSPKAKLWRPWEER